MKYIDELKRLNPSFDQYDDMTIYEALPAIDPERFGGMSLQEVADIANMDEREYEIYKYEQEGGGIGSSVQRGLLRLNQTFNAAGAKLGDTVMGAMPDSFRNSELGQWLQSEADTDKQDILNDQQKIQALPQRPEMQRAVDAANNAGSTLDAIYAFAREINESPDTFGFLIDQAAELTPQVATQLMIGVVTRNPELAIGLGSAASTYGSNTAQYMDGNVENFQDASNRAAVRSGAQAVVDAATGSALRFKIGPNQGTNIIGQTGVQMLGGAGGEYAGATAAGEEIDRGELIAEGMLEALGLPGDVASYAINRSQEASVIAQRKEQAGKALDEISVLRAQLDAELDVGIQPTDDPLSQESKRAQNLSTQMEQRMQLDIAEVQMRDIVNGKEERTVQQVRSEIEKAQAEELKAQEEQRIAQAEEQRLRDNERKREEAAALERPAYERNRQINPLTNLPEQTLTGTPDGETEQITDRLDDSPESQLSIAETNARLNPTPQTQAEEVRWTNIVNLQRRMEQAVRDRADPLVIQRLQAQIDRLSADRREDLPPVERVLDQANYDPRMGNGDYDPNAAWERTAGENPEFVRQGGEWVRNPNFRSESIDSTAEERASTEFDQGAANTQWSGYDVETNAPTGENNPPSATAALPNMDGRPMGYDPRPDDREQTQAERDFSERQRQQAKTRLKEEAQADDMLKLEQDGRIYLGYDSRMEERDLRELQRRMTAGSDRALPAPSIPSDLYQRLMEQRRQAVRIAEKNRTDEQRRAVQITQAVRDKQITVDDDIPGVVRNALEQQAAAVNKPSLPRPEAPSDSRQMDEDPNVRQLADIANRNNDVTLMGRDAEPEQEIVQEPVQEPEPEQESLQETEPDSQPQVLLSSTGKGFASERSAKASKAFRENKDKGAYVNRIDDISWGVYVPASTESDAALESEQVTSTSPEPDSGMRSSYDEFADFTSIYQMGSYFRENTDYRKRLKAAQFMKDVAPDVFAKFSEEELAMKGGQGSLLTTNQVTKANKAIADWKASRAPVEQEQAISPDDQVMNLLSEKISQNKDAVGDPSRVTLRTEQKPNKSGDGTRTVIYLDGEPADVKAFIDQEKAESGKKMPIAAPSKQTGVASISFPEAQQRAQAFASRFKQAAQEPDFDPYKVESVEDAESVLFAAKDDADLEYRLRSLMQVPTSRRLAKQAFSGVATVYEDSDNSFLKTQAERALRESRGTDLRDSLMSRTAGDLSGVELSNSDGTRGAFFLPDATEPGKFRVSYFDERGFFGHATRDTYEAALDDALSNGFRQEDPGKLAKMSQMESFSRGNEVTNLIARVNAGQMNYQDYLNAAKVIDGQADNDFNPETAVRIAADSVQQLRPVDVFRVIDQDYTPEQRQQVADYIISNNRKLKPEVDWAMAEIGSDAVHSDRDGSDVEAVTPEVIDEAVTDSVRSDEFANSQDAREYLRLKLDDAIANAKERGLMTEADSFDMANKEQMRIAFNVPGDGKFTIPNNVEALEAFKKKVNSTGQKGFMPYNAQRAGAGGVENGSGSAKNAIKNFLNEREYSNAWEIAKLANLEEWFTQNYPKEAKEAEDGYNGPEVERGYKYEKPFRHTDIEWSKTGRARDPDGIQYLARVYPEGGTGMIYGIVKDQGKEYPTLRYVASDDQSFNTLPEAKAHEIEIVNDKLRRDGYMKPSSNGTGVNEPNIGYSVNEPTESNYERDPDKQTEADDRAISQAERTVSELTRLRTGSLLANKLAADFRDRGATSLIGQEINDHSELADLAEVYRNPSFETFRIIMLKGNKVVHQTGITSRMPAAVTLWESDEHWFATMRDLRETMDRVKADGYYIMHNHPSGNPTPSWSDRVATDKINKALPGMISHMIINGTKYTMLDPDGINDELFTKERIDTYDETDPYNQLMPHPLLTKDITSADELYNVAAELRDNSDNHFQLISKGRMTVQGIASFPNSMLEGPMTERKRLRLLAEIRQFERRTGGMMIFAVNVDQAYENIFREGIERGALTDVLLRHSTATQTLQMKGVSKESDIRNRAIRVNEEAGSYNPEPRQPNAVDEAFNSLGNKDRTVWQKVKRGLKREFASGGLLPDSVFKAKILRDSQANAMEFDIAQHIGTLDRAINKAYGKSYNKLTTEQQEALNAQMTSTEPDTSIPESVREALMKMRYSIRALSEDYVQVLQEEKELLADGPAKENKQELIDIIINNFDSYAHRSYRAFDDPDWPKKVDRQVFDNAVNFLQAGYVGQGMNQVDAQRKAIQTARSILEEGTAYEGLEAFIKESKLGSKDLTILKKRQDIAPEIRELLGEYKDVKINFAKTITKMARLVTNTRFLEKVKELGMDEGWLFTEDTRPTDESVTKLAADGSESFSPLNGYYVANDVEQAFRDVLGHENMGDFYRFIVRANGMVKYGKTVLSPTTAARNWMSAAFFALANGHFDFTEMAKSVSHFGTYFNKTGSEGKVAYLRKLKELGVIYDTPYAGEMMDLLADANVETFIKSDGVLGGLKAFNEVAKKFYQYGDDFWKIVGFENEKRMLMKYKGMDDAAAEVAAAERIRNTYPTYSMTGKFVKQLRRFPLAGTFVSFPAEILRTTYHMLRYLQQDFKDSKAYGMRKVMGLAAVSGAAYAAQALTKEMFDIDDDEEQAVRLMAAPWNKNSNFLFTGRDEKGNLEYFDISFLDPYNYFKRPINAIMRGEAWDKTAVDIAGEMLKPFFGTDIAAGAIMEVMSNQKASGGRVFNEVAPWDEQLIDITNHLRKALQPGAVGNIERTFKALNGQMSPSGRKFTIEDEIWAGLGWRRTTFDPKTALYYRSFEFKDQKSSASSMLNQAARNPNEITDDELRSAYDNATTARNKAYNDMMRLITAAKASGMNDYQIRVALKNSGISKKDIAALMKGEIPKWEISSTSLRNTIRKAELLYDQDVVQDMERRNQLIQNF